ncbi:MAG: hypothetical protein WKF31_01085 [Thermoleophilaceae bacterium]
MVGERLLSELLGDQVGQLLRPRARAGVDDGGEGVLAAQRLEQQRVLLVAARMGDREGEVRPVEARRHPERVSQPQPAHDVGGDLGGGRGRRGHHGARAHEAGGVGQPEVVGPEVVAPLRHAVGLVHHEETHARLPHPLGESGEEKRSGAT